MLSFIKNGANIFRNKQEDILSAAFVIAFSVALSRVLGLVRYRLLASYFGDNIKLLDSFIAASILPDAIFEVLIFGTIALAFIPIFSQYLSRDKLEKAWRLSSIFYNLGIIISIVFLSPVIGIYAPAFGMILGALLHMIVQFPLVMSLGFKFNF